MTPLHFAGVVYIEFLRIINKIHFAMYKYSPAIYKYTYTPTWLQPVINPYARLKHNIDCIFCYIIYRCSHYWCLPPKKK